MSAVCFVDTETTGRHPDRHEMWEVGVITSDGVERQWLLPVDRLQDSDPVALSVGRFHDRHPQGNRFPRFGPFGGVFRPEKEAWHPAHKGLPALVSRKYFAEDFARLTHDCHLVGAVISFDEERLRRLLWSEGVQPGWHYHLIDVEALAAGYLAGKQDSEPGWGYFQHLTNPTGPRPPWNSNDLSRVVGIDPEDFERHTALGDCRWAKAIYEAVLGVTQ